MSYVFFFQAEDGIRDLVRSRGLGDVYKRQGNDVMQIVLDGEVISGNFINLVDDGKEHNVSCESVSYTHLTLPTSDLV